MFTFPTEEDEQAKEERFLAEKDAQRASKMDYLGSLDNQIQRDKSFLDQIGETSWDAVKATGSGIMEILDTLGTPAQWGAGAVAKASGAKDYKDLDWLGAASLGAEKNRSQLDNLREAGVLKNSPVLRGALGFAADVVTDPLNWVSIFPQGASIAGRALSDVAVPSITGKLETARDIANRIEQTHFEKLTSLLGDVPEGEARQLMLADAGVKAKGEARKAFERAIAVASKDKMYQRSGAASLAPEAVAIARAKDLAETGLGLQNIEDVNKLFKPKTLRFSSPFAGLPGIGEKMPILGTREADIPIVSDAIVKLHEGLSNSYYGLKQNVRNWIPEALEPTSSSMNRFAASFVQGAANKLGGAHAWTVNRLGAVSQRIASTGRVLGDRQRADQIANYQRDAEYAFKVIAAQAGMAGDEIAQFSDGEEILKHITKSMDSVNDVGEREWMQAQEMMSKLPPDERKIAEQAMKARPFPPPEVADKVLNDELLKRLGGDQQKHAAAMRLASHIRKRYDALAKADHEAGLLGNVLDNYFLHAYDPTDFKGDWDTLLKSTISQASKAAGGPLTDFTKLRKFPTIQQAIGAGLKPEENALKLLMAREHASKIAHLQKEFAERMAWQHGVRPEVYQAITAVAKDQSSKQRLAAAAALNDMGIVNRADLTIPALQFNSGEVMDIEKWDNMADRLKFSDPESLGYKEMIENTTQMRTIDGVEIPHDQFFADPKYRELVGSMSEGYKKSLEMVPGYYGQSALAAAGGTTIRPFLRSKMLSKLDPEDHLFWDNVIPTPLAGALEEAYSTGDWLRRHVDKNSLGKAKNDTIRALDGSLSFLGKANKLLKAGMLSIWPARYTRDLMSAGFQSGLVSTPFEQVGAAAKNLAQLPIQGSVMAATLAEKIPLVGPTIGEGARKLGEFLNFPSIAHANTIFSGADLVSLSGKKISNKELQLAAMRAGFEWNGNYSTDLVASINDMIEEAVSSPAVRAVAPGIGKLGKKAPELTAVQKGTSWALKKRGIALEDRHWQAFPDFAERLERYGRTNTFIELVKRDFDFEEAASLANRMHVDYKNAKTPFERKFLNNLFFFYSFSRGNASTLAQSLMKKPGALTTQMHAREAIAEMLRDPNTYVDDPDIEESVRSKRMNESMALYMGTSKKSGMPTFLSGVGLPIEDITKYTAISLPSSLSLRDVIRAGAQSAKRSSQLIGSQTNPLIKTAIETMTGRSLFYDRPLTDETLRKIPKWERDSSILNKIPFRAIPKEVWDGVDTVTKEVLDAKDNGDGTFTVNPYNLALISVILPGLASIAPANPVIGALSPLKYTSRFFPTRRKLTEAGVSDRDKALGFLTGLKIDEIDPEASAKYDESRDIQNYLEYLGIPKSKLRRAQMMQAETGDE